jgi:LysR family transcriptional regulator, carnitine catabolism transcriptional activator
VTMLSNDTDGIGTVVASGQADIGLGVDEVFDEGVERILLGRQQIVALVPAARSEGEGAAALTDLLRIGLITSPRDDVTRRLLAERLGEGTVDEAVVAETISVASMIPLVRAGVGVAFLPESVADTVGEGVVLCRTRPPLTRDIWMFHGSTPSPAAQAFIETTSRLRDEGGMGNAG